MRQGHVEQPFSRYACCTPGVLGLCVRAVAAEGYCDDVIPGWSGREVALVARDALEALELIPNIGDLLMDREVRKGDWALTVLAEARFLASQKYRELRQPALARDARDLALAAIEDAAASFDRSHVLWYEDIFFDAAQALVRRGDRTGLVRQIECIAEALRQPGGGNVRGSLRDLALFHLDLAEHQVGLSLLAGLQRHCPSDLWTYNVIAMRFADYGPSSSPDSSAIPDPRPTAQTHRRMRSRSCATRSTPTSTRHPPSALRSWPCGSFPRWRRRASKRSPLRHQRLPSPGQPQACAAC